jgi:cobalt-zinc-cadmium efflux system membrane fusion protein
MLEEETMTFRLCQGGVALSLFAGFALIAGGCGQTETKSGQAKAKGTAEKDKSALVADAKKGHDHGGWWCDEHGVPEDVCGQCNAKLAAEFKKKGDWCNDHDRPKSQCFKCDPKLKDKFAAQYRAKYGKEPPPTEDEEKKDDKKG